MSEAKEKKEKKETEEKKQGEKLFYIMKEYRKEALAEIEEH